MYTIKILNLNHPYINSLFSISSLIIIPNTLSILKSAKCFLNLHTFLS